MSKKPAVVFAGIITVFTVSCSSGVTGSQDVGDIDRTQPDKIRGIWDTPSDPDSDSFAPAIESNGIDDTDGGGPENLSTDATNFKATAERPFRYY